MGEKRRHPPPIWLIFRARDFRQRGILPAHRRISQSHSEVGPLIAGVLLRVHLQDPPRRVERSIGALLVPRTEMNQTFKKSLRDHRPKSAVDPRQALQTISRENA